MNSALQNCSFVVTFKEGELQSYRTLNWFMLKNSKWLEEDFTFPDVFRSTIYSTAGSSPKKKFKPRLCPRGQHPVSMWLHILISRM
jgi:hypothetical protein